MANTFKNIKKKLRRKRLLAEKRHLEKAQAGAGGNEAARRKIKAALRRKKAVLKPVAVILIAVFVVLAGFLFLEKRKPDSMVSWLLIFIIFPFIGFLIYLIFGRDFSKKKIFRLYSNEEKLMIELKKKNLDLYKEKKLNFKLSFL